MNDRQFGAGFFNFFLNYPHKIGGIGYANMQNIKLCKKTRAQQIINLKILVKFPYRSPYLAITQNTYFLFHDFLSVFNNFTRKAQDFLSEKVPKFGVNS